MKPIKMGKKYRLRKGLKATILTTSRKDAIGYTVISIDEEGTIRPHKADGHCLYGPDWDLIEENPYADFKVDDIVITPNGTLRYFACEIGGKPYCWDFGATSMAATGCTRFEHVRKPTAEELGEISLNWRNFIKGLKDETN